MRTTFEVITGRLGSQNAIGGGGRYNGLVRDLGGPDVPAVGFAIGMERLIMLLQQEQSEKSRALEVKTIGQVRITDDDKIRFFVAGLGEQPRAAAFLLVQQLRGLGLEAEMDYEGRSLKSQMRRADKSGARYVIMLGEDEMTRREIQLRDMLTKTQRMLPLDDIVNELKQLRD
jgi:histidyl-tRNA synthetase